MVHRVLAEAALGGDPIDARAVEAPGREFACGMVENSRARARSVPRPRGFRRAPRRRPLYFGERVHSSFMPLVSGPTAASHRLATTTKPVTTMKVFVSPRTGHSQAPKITGTMPVATRLAVDAQPNPV